MPRLSLLISLVLAGCSSSSSPPPTPLPSPKADDPPPPRRTTAAVEQPPEAKNVVFTAPPAADRVPTVRAIDLSPTPNASAIWGGTGRDHRGRIYFGISAEGGGVLSAHLVEYDPATGTTADRGGAVENLTRLGLAKPGESQNKIHTKIWQAADGYLYFASMDEGGEKEDGTRPQTFDSHLWRVKPDGTDWEHLAAVREAVIAAALGGRYVYLLGYFGHVVYQWDTERGTLANSVRVGSVGGHTTRNFFADNRGHVFVPRVTAAKVELVEFDERLQEVAAFPLAGYGTTPDSSSHGILGVTQLADDGFAFVTDRGRLYRLTPRATGSALVDLGNLHPAGECYCATLFTFDGESSLVGIGHRPGGGRQYEWIRFDLRTRRSTAAKVAVPIPDGASDVLIYGSQTRDDDGAFYVAGRYATPGSRPAAWRVGP